MVFRWEDDAKKFPMAEADLSVLFMSIPFDFNTLPNSVWSETLYVYTNNCLRSALRPCTVATSSLVLDS